MFNILFQHLTLRPFLQRITQILGVGIGLYSFAANAQEHYRYHYVPLNKLALPQGVSRFDPTTLDDQGRVYGATSHVDGEAERVAVYADGVLTIKQAGYPTKSSSRGMLGGYAEDPETGLLHAALFRGDRTTLLPRLGAEELTWVMSVNDAGLALVWSDDPNVRDNFRVFSRGKSVWEYQLPTGSNCNCWALNSHGVVVGAIVDPSTPNTFRAVRFRPQHDEPTAFEPNAPYTDSSTFGINERGYVLVVSSSWTDPQVEYGLWDRKGNYKAYFEGTSYTGLLNDENLIVLTGNYGSDFDSYIVPQPGTRLNLADLLDNPDDVETSISDVRAVNRHGDMVGYGRCGDHGCPSFLLKRIRPECDE